MKNILLVLAAAASLSASAFGELKIGTVDMVTLVKSHPSYETNKKLLTDMEQDYRKNIDDRRDELDKLQEKGQKLADEYKNPMLAQTAKAKLETELTAIQKDFLAKQQEIRTVAAENQAHLAELESKLLKIQADDIKTWIAGFAKEGGYDFVFDAAAVAFARDGYDVTDGVVKFMNSHPKAKVQNEGK